MPSQYGMIEDDLYSAPDMRGITEEKPVSFLKGVLGQSVNLQGGIIDWSEPLCDVELVGGDDNSRLLQVTLSIWNAVFTTQFQPLAQIEYGGGGYQIQTSIIDMRQGLSLSLPGGYVRVRARLTGAGATVTVGAYVSIGGKTALHPTTSPILSNTLGAGAVVNLGQLSWPYSQAIQFFTDDFLNQNILLDFESIVGGGATFQLAIVPGQNLPIIPNLGQIANVKATNLGAAPIDLCYIHHVDL